jgi:predicted nucleic acid-binding protein
LRFHATLPDWLRVRPIVDQRQADDLGDRLDQGEAEAIVLAEECRVDYLLIDEKLGREQAEARGLTAIGLLGVLLLAKRAGHLASVADVIDQLQTVAGFFVSDRVKSMVLQAAGETS